MVTPNEMLFALIRTYARQNDFKPITISKDEWENRIGLVTAKKEHNEDGSVTITYEVIK